MGIFNKLYSFLAEEEPMNSINKKEITSIFEKMKEQKEAGFNDLYNKYKQLVKKIAFSILKDEEASKDISQIVFTKIYKLPKEKLPIEEFLKTQGRFKHLFKPGNEHLIQEIQEEVDRRWEDLLYKCNR